MPWYLAYARTVTDKTLKYVTAYPTTSTVIMSGHFPTEREPVKDQALSKLMLLVSLVHTKLDQQTFD